MYEKMTKVLNGSFILLGIKLQSGRKQTDLPHKIKTRFRGSNGKNVLKAF